MATRTQTWLQSPRSRRLAPAPPWGALRNPDLVSDSLRLRAASAVGELTCIPNQMASALASAQTNTIGVVTPSLANGVFGDYLGGIRDMLTRA